MKPDPLTHDTLDALVVCGAMLIVGGVVFGLVTRSIPENNLPVLAGLGGTVLALVTAYAGFRWGASTTSGKPAPKDEPATGKPGDPVHITPEVEP